MWIQTLETQARRLTKRFNKIILTAYVGLVLIAGLLFWIEYKGVYKGYLTNLDLHFKMESKILDFGLEDKDHTLETVPIIDAEFCTSCIINDKDMVVKHSHEPVAKGTPLSAVLPENLKDSYQGVLLGGRPIKSVLMQMEVGPIKRPSETQSSLLSPWLIRKLWKNKPSLNPLTRSSPLLAP